MPLFQNFKRCHKPFLSNNASLTDIRIKVKKKINVILLQILNDVTNYGEVITSCLIKDFIRTPYYDA